MIELTCLGAAVVSFVLALLATPVTKRLAFMTGCINMPRQDRHSQKPTPLLGGVAILIAFLLPCLMALVLVHAWADGGAPHWLGSVSVHLSGAMARSDMAIVILGGAIVLHVLGLIDDRRGLGAWFKLACQFAIASGVVWLGGLRLLTLLGEPWSMLTTTFWIVLITNSFNFLDNMDGLSAGVAFICTAALLAAAAASGQVFVGAMLCMLLGSLGGFLVYNFPPAGIYMGDAGSLVVGYLVAVLSILTTYYHHSPCGPYFGVFAPVVVLAMPLYDTASVIYLRLSLRLNPMIGDTRHFSHRLLRRGMSTRKAVLTIYAATLATAVGATILPYVDKLRAVLIVAQTLAVLLIIALMESSDAKGKP